MPEVPGIVVPPPPGYGTDGNCLCEECRREHMDVPEMYTCSVCWRLVRIGTDCDCRDCSECGQHEDDCNCEQPCPTCGDYIEQGDTCGNCAGGLLCDYGYKPRPIFHGDGPLYLGMELEIETPNRSKAAEVASAGFGNLVYLKTDSSIGHGFEIVSHPMDHEYTLSKVDWKTLDKIRRTGAYVNEDSNGLHVHVSRAGFDSDCHAYRWMKLFYRNEKKVRRVARRRSDEWAAFDSTGRKAHKRTATKSPNWSTRDYSYDYGGRYQAINTLNDPTFEVRVFASSLNQREVTGTLSFVASTVEYTRGLNASKILKEDAWSWDKYTSWLRSSEAKPFSPATTYLESLCVC